MRRGSRWQQICMQSKQLRWKMDSIPNLGSRSTGGQTIMLVEDEAFVRGVTRAVLESAGYSVVAVGEALEAQAMFERQGGAIDLLLTDVALPGEDGRRLGRRLSKSNSRLQVLLVTGYLEEIEGRKPEDREEGENLLRKPFSASTLLNTVRHLLRPRS
jgi:two-component system cell cycle sensor histidine kinase/response regulator CckA